MVRRTSTAIEAFPLGTASAHGGMRLNQRVHARSGRHKTLESTADTTFRARGSFPIVSENENYEKRLLKSVFFMPKRKMLSSFGMAKFLSPAKAVS